VAGGVDDVDLLASPLTGGRRRGNGDTTLLLLLHPVHGSCTVMHLTDLVLYPGIEKDSFGCSRFSRIDMRSDSYISQVFQFV